MNNIQIFNNDEFGEVRTINKGGEILFVARDVAKALGYAKPENAVRDRVNEKDTLKQGILSNGGIQETLCINEAGLYSLIFGSKLENARKFQDWVTHDVLPSIRKTGGYQLPITTDGKIQLLAQGQVEIRQEIDEIKQSIQTLNDDMPLFPVDTEKITKAVKRKGVEVMGGIDSMAYHDRSIASTVYRDIYREIKRQFEVSSYKEICRRDADKVVEIVERYTLPYALAERVLRKNVA